MVVKLWNDAIYCTQWTHISASLPQSAGNWRSETFRFKLHRSLAVSRSAAYMAFYRATMFLQLIERKCSAMPSA